ncbi:hypothetical protein QO000_002020 [Alkalihalobacillus hemicentroti]|uniref:Uncharacterized protein n=1 Tax=Guptibacillus hwajinpoensis TaxID=208199 RepID=A0ABU0K122_9BACL|nr:hypothetical protein [Alkalihalobacillus hemicentroti]
MKTRNGYDPKTGAQGEKEGENALLMNKKRGPQNERPKKK